MPVLESTSHLDALRVWIWFRVRARLGLGSWCQFGSREIFKLLYTVNFSLLCTFVRLWLKAIRWALLPCAVGCERVCYPLMTLPLHCCSLVIIMYCVLCWLGTATSREKATRKTSCWTAKTGLCSILQLLLKDDLVCLSICAISLFFMLTKC